MKRKICRRRLPPPLIRRHQLHPLLIWRRRPPHRRRLPPPLISHRRSLLPPLIHLSPADAPPASDIDQPASSEVRKKPYEIPSSVLAGMSPGPVSAKVWEALDMEATERERHYHKESERRRLHFFKCFSKVNKEMMNDHE